MLIKPVFRLSIKSLLVLSTILCTGVFVSNEPAMGQQIAGLPNPLEALSGFYRESPEKTHLTEFLKAGRVGDMMLDNADALRAFYESRQGEPFWVGANAPGAAGAQFAGLIEKSWTHALNPQRYHLQEISDRLGQPDSVMQAELELFLTDAAVKYTQDMLGQRLQGRRLEGEVAYLRPLLTPVDILMKLSGASSPAVFFKALEPESATYKILQKALADLSATPAEGYESLLPIKIEQVLKPGQHHKNIPSVRARLGAAAQTADLTLYDDALYAAVMKFQRENELKDDGIIGGETLVALNRTNRDRLLQLKVNMERLRWMEGQEKPDKFIVVNIPAATLWAVEGGNVSFEMPVIVGRPARPTPPLMTEITGVRFNPNWTVPPTIKKEDILPKLREDPQYLTSKGIEIVYRGDGYIETIDPASVDWDDITSSELHSLHMVQVPGANNPLGQVRVLMPNQYSIYLHDTNHRDDFNKSARALSSGCVRLKEPLKVAEFIMEDEKGWSMDKINSVIAQGKTSDRLIANRIPVYILYYTVWLDSKGRVVFGRDLYNRDGVLASALDKVDGKLAEAHNGIMGNPPRGKLASVGPGG